jgi:hypothetical protein
MRRHLAGVVDFQQAAVELLIHKLARQLEKTFIYRLFWPDSRIAGRIAMRAEHRPGGPFDGPVEPENADGIRALDIRPAQRSREAVAQSGGVDRFTPRRSFPFAASARVFLATKDYCASILHGEMIESVEVR